MKRLQAGLIRTFARSALVIMLAALTALLCASAGALRERARRSVCMSHLRLIGRALAMYSADYGGVSGPTSPSEMALPPTLAPVMSGVRAGVYPCGDGKGDIFQCPDAPASWAEGAPRRSDYLYQNWTGLPAPPSVPPWRVALARRGMAFPIVVDLNHAVPVRGPGRSRYTQLVVVLRLDGRAASRRVPYPGYSWTW